MPDSGVCQSSNSGDNRSPPPQPLATLAPQPIVVTPVNFQTMPPVTQPAVVQPNTPAESVQSLTVKYCKNNADYYRAYCSATKTQQQQQPPDQAIVNFCSEYSQRCIQSGSGVTYLFWHFIMLSSKKN